MVSIASLALLISCAGGPNIARCTIGSSGCICFDPRLPEDKQHFVLTFEQCRNYVAVSPDDAKEYADWCDKKRKEQKLKEEDNWK